MFVNKSEKVNVSKRKPDAIISGTRTQYQWVISVVLVSTLPGEYIVLMSDWLVLYVFTCTVDVTHRYCGCDSLALRVINRCCRCDLPVLQVWLIFTADVTSALVLQVIHWHYRCDLLYCGCDLPVLRVIHYIVLSDWLVLYVVLMSDWLVLYVFTCTVDVTHRYCGCDSLALRVINRCCRCDLPVLQVWLIFTADVTSALVLQVIHWHYRCDLLYCGCDLPVLRVIHYIVLSDWLVLYVFTCTADVTHRYCGCDSLALEVINRCCRCDLPVLQVWLIFTADVTSALVLQVIHWHYRCDLSYCGCDLPVLRVIHYIVLSDWLVLYALTCTADVTH